MQELSIAGVKGDEETQKRFADFHLLFDRLHRYQVLFHT